MGQVFRRQGYHLAAYVTIAAFLYGAIALLPEGQGVRRGLTTAEWIWLSWVLAGAHQAWIWFFWRMALYLGKIRRWFGAAGFPLYKIGYVVLGLARLLCIVPISSSSPHTAPIPPLLALALIVLSTPLIVWVAYSFAVYFGFDRAAGADHFDPDYRGMPLETRGAFRYFRNPGYSVGLLLLYHPGLLWQSALGLIVAAAHHVFVWVAYFCSELPDMEEIYGRRGRSGPTDAA